mgnify:CR=1 FL=1
MVLNEVLKVDKVKIIGYANMRRNHAKMLRKQNIETITHAVRLQFHNRLQQLG